MVLFFECVQQITFDLLELDLADHLIVPYCKLISRNNNLYSKINFVVSLML